MRANIVVTVVVAFLTYLAAAAQQERTVDIFAWPLSASKSQTLAQLSYTSSNATVKSYTAPKAPNDEDIIRIGFYHPSGSWSGVATSASNLQPQKEKRLQLHLNTNGELYHVGFKVSDIPSSSESGKGTDGMSVEVVKMQQGPTPHLNKPVVLSADGSVPNKEPEKTFIQKYGASLQFITPCFTNTDTLSRYWWVIVGFLVLQVVIGGAGKE